MLRLNASISLRNLIAFGKQFYVRDTHTVNACLRKYRAWILERSGIRMNDSQETAVLLWYVQYCVTIW